METLEIKYNKLLEQIKNINEKIDRLEKDPKVIKYLNLKKSHSDLIRKYKSLFTELRQKEFSSCRHIWIPVYSEYDPHEGRRSIYYGCIKCGLNENIARNYRIFFNHKIERPLEEKVIYDYLYAYPDTRFIGTHLNIRGDFNLIRNVYLKIKENHPNIDDKSLITYIRHALKCINDIKISEERQINRAHRLSLSKNFKNWSSKIN